MRGARRLGSGRSCATSGTVVNETAWSAAIVSGGSSVDVRHPQIVHGHRAGLAGREVGVRIERVARRPAGEATWAPLIEHEIENQLPATVTGSLNVISCWRSAPRCPHRLRGSCRHGRRIPDHGVCAEPVVKRVVGEAVPPVTAGDRTRRCRSGRPSTIWLLCRSEACVRPCSSSRGTVCPGSRADLAGQRRALSCP